MRFKDKEDYLAQRNLLMDEADKLLAEAKTKEAEAKMKEIEKMDNDWDKDSKELANIEALKNKMSSLGAKTISGGEQKMNTNIENITDSMDYRKAFMNYVMKGTAIPSEFLNTDAVTKTTDAGAVIPDTVLQKIIDKMEATGMIYSKVTKSAIKGGVTIPTSSVKPSATWVAEGAGSDKQKKTTGTITFSYYKLRCAVAVTLEMDTMALSIFETTLINNVTEAMVKAIEQAIISGDGSGKPKGILKETVATGQNIDVAKTGSLAYDTLIKAEAALPLAYENGAVWLMTKKTFMEFIGLVDQNDQPIARVNYGLGGRPERTLLGRTVILNDYMSSYVAAPTADIIVAALFNMSDYVLNTNLNMTIKKYEDNDTDDKITKAVMLVDGKVVDKNSLVTITKKSA